MLPNAGCERLLSTAATAIASGYAAGYIGALPAWPLLPPAASTTSPLLFAYWIACSMPGRLAATEAQVDDPGAVIGGPDDTLGDVRGDAAAVRVEHAHRKDVHVGRGAGDAEPVVDVGGDDPGDVRAVTVGVDAAVVARVHVVHAREHRAGEILVVGLDTGVDDRDDDAPAPGHRPRRLERDLVERPLLRAHRVVLAAGDLERVDGLVALDAEDLRARRRRSAALVASSAAARPVTTCEVAVGGLGDDPGVGRNRRGRRPLSARAGAGDTAERERRDRRTVVAIRALRAERRCTTWHSVPPERIV